MTLASDFFGQAIGLTREVAGGTAGTYAQGSNTKAATTVPRHRRSAVSGQPGDLEAEAARLLFPADFFASGFSGTNPIQPSAGDTYTVAGEAKWTVDKVDTLGFGEGFGLDVSRRRQQGGA